MNVAFFLTPKSEVAWIPLGATLRQALERMHHHRYAAVPILDLDGCYVGTLTEGDMLWYLTRTPGVRLDDVESLRVHDVPRRLEVRAVDVLTEIDQLLHVAIDQNFVPVVDSRNVLMGIVRRRAILEYFAEKLAKDRLSR